MAYQKPELNLIRDNVIRVYQPEVVEPLTYLTATVAAAGTALTVRDNSGFANYDLLLFEGFGVEGAEIKKVNGVVTAGTSMTASTLTFAHGIDTLVQKVLFNQIEISGAATLTGSKTVIATIDINAGANYNDYIVSGTTYAYYFARFYNSLAQTPYYGEYSDGLVSTDFTPLMVGFIRRNAFKNAGEIFGGKYDNQWLYDQLYLCEEDLMKAKPRWGQLVINDYDLGNITTGDARIALPSDISDDETNKSIFGLRISTNDNMSYIPVPEFENLMYGVGQTTLASTAAIGATTLVLTDSNDFADSGSVNIGGTSYSYTTNTRSTDTLSGLTALSAEITAGVNVWQNITFGQPYQYTVKNGYIYWPIPPSSDFNGRNVWIDYYKTATRQNSDTDIVSFNDSQLYISWLEMAIKKEKNNGEIAPTDSSFIQYNLRKQQLIIQDKIPAGLKLIPGTYNRRMNRFNFN